MMSFAWRWAQVGDRVQVHDREAPHALVPGVVARVRRSLNGVDVAIRLDDGSSVQPYARQYVHSDPKDPAEPCPLCALADSGGTAPARTTAIGNSTAVGS